MDSIILHSIAQKKLDEHVFGNILGLCLAAIMEQRANCKQFPFTWAYIMAVDSPGGRGSFLMKKIFQASLSLDVFLEHTQAHAQNLHALGLLNEF